VVKHYRY